MLVELSVVEQRYHAVMEVLSAGAPVVEVADRYGVSGKTVHAWIRQLPHRRTGGSGGPVPPAAPPPVAARLRPRGPDLRAAPPCGSG